MMHKKKRQGQRAGLFAVLLCVMGSFNALAARPDGVTLSRTRIILGDDRRAAPLGIRNSATHPWLVQVRVLTANGQDAPLLIVLPPLLRLEAGSSAQVRIMAAGDLSVLPSDRESVWYVHALMVPPSSSFDAEDTASFRVGMESIIKLFWRPSVLREPDDKVFRQVRFSGRGEKIRACNLTRYYLSLGSLAFNGVRVDLNRQPSMLAPLGCEDFAGTGKKVSWSMINDFGGNSNVFEGDIQ
ncbi:MULTISPECIES: fimbrial biogenesis chaperone [Lelliottia]|nr:MULTISPECIES: molecular chaperone [Lelliottia]